MLSCAYPTIKRIDRHERLITVTNAFGAKDAYLMRKFKRMAVIYNCKSFAVVDIKLGYYIRGLCIGHK